MLLRRLLTLKQKATSILQFPRITIEGNDGKFASPNNQTTNMEDSETGLTQLSHQAITLPPQRNLNLSEARIHSDMLLRLPFTKWTISSLNAASSTLTKLSLKMTVNANVTWKAFSRRLFLPLLKKFSLTNLSFLPVDVPEFVDIEIFLENHPSIQDLCLYGVHLPASSEAIPRPTFRNLVKFNGHPYYVVWLLKSTKLDITALPNLERVGISSDCYAGSSRLPDYTLFEPALEAIAGFGKNLDLAFTLNFRGSITFWFESHVLKAQSRGGSIFSQLTNVSTLVIYNAWYTPSMMAIFPEWLRLFPSLRHLRFERAGVVNVVCLTDTAFVSSVAKLCPSLETMAVNQEPIIDLRRMRRNRKDG